MARNRNSMSFTRHHCFKRTYKRDSLAFFITHLNQCSMLASIHASSKASKGSLENHSIPGCATHRKRKLMSTLAVYFSRPSKQLR